MSGSTPLAYPPYIPDKQVLSEISTILVASFVEQRRYSSIDGLAEQVSVRVFSFLSLVAVVRAFSPLPRETIDASKLQLALPYVARNSTVCALLRILLIAASQNHPDDVEHLRSLMQRARTNHGDFLLVLKEMCTKEHQLSRQHDAGEEPIHSIPSAILRRIFLHCTDAPPSRSLPGGSRKSPPLPMVLRSVCRKWSEVAKNTPALWSNVSANRGSAYVQFAVEKTAPDGPLDVSLMADDVLTACLIFPQAQDRVKRLQFTLQNDTSPYALQDCLNDHPLPKLESLTVRFVDGDVLDLSSTIFRHSAPTGLTALHLSYVNIHHQSLVFHLPLVNLTLFNCTPWDSLDKLFAALSSMPTLQHLMWQMSDMEALELIHMPSLESQYQSQSIALPSLRTIEIIDDARRALAILDRLAFPASTEALVHLDCDALQSAEQYKKIRSRLDRIVGQRLASAHSQPGSGFGTLILTSAPAARGAKTEHHGFTITLEHPLDASGPKNWAFAMYNFRAAILDNVEPLRRVISWPVVCSVKKLAIWHASFRKGGAAWAPTLDALSTVEVVEPEIHAAGGLVDALQRHPTLLPRLDKIIIRNAELSESDMDALSEVLRTRQTPLSVSIFRCDVKKGCAGQLQSITEEKGAAFFWDSFEDALSAVRSPYSFL